MEALHMLQAKKERENENALHEKKNRVRVGRNLQRRNELVDESIASYTDNVEERIHGARGISYV